VEADSIESGLMRVLVVVHGFPPFHQGGSEIYAETHARALQRLYGDDILVLTRDNDASRKEYEVRLERRHDLRIARINNTFRVIRSFEDTYRNEALARVAARLIQDFDPEAAHIHHLTCLSTTIVSILAAREIPIVFTLHDYWLMCHRGQLLDANYQLCDGPGPGGCGTCLGTEAGARPVLFAGASVVRAVQRRMSADAARRLHRMASTLGRLASIQSDTAVEARRRDDHMRHLAEHVTHFLAPSRAVRERFVKFGFPAERITVSETGLDHTRFAGAERTSGSVLRLGFLGSLMISKGPHILLEAYARLPPGAATVDLFGGAAAYHGDDSYQLRLEPLLSMAGVRVHGAIPPDEVRKALSSIDVLVVPSIWPESSGMVIREAFLAGVPVVASNIGGIPEVVEEGRGGLLFRANDVDDLHQTLARFLSNPTLSHTLRAAIPSVRTIEDDVRQSRRLYERDRGTMERASPRVAAIVLNYRTPQDTFLAVTSLRASSRPPDDVIVVDNDPSEDCRAALATVAGSITYVRTGSNLGFSGGMNVGIRTALDRGANMVLLVNSDVVVGPDCIGRLESALTRTGGAGIAGPMILARSEPGRVASMGISYAPASGRMRHRCFGARSSDFRAASIQSADAVAGCFMLVRREVFDRVGLFDERFFFSFEELDLCLRARNAGFATILVGEAVAYHEGSRSVGKESPRRLYFAARNHLLLAATTSPPLNPVASFCRASSIVMLNVTHALTASGGSLPTRLREVVRGTYDYFTGCFGAGS
jgi:GT2 family glycosyltransferase/glycosyltransferase involved in cell wall biosynthesis